jgi:hypothetical protein
MRLGMGGAPRNDDDDDDDLRQIACIIIGLLTFRPYTSIRIFVSFLNPQRETRGRRSQER